MMPQNPPPMDSAGGIPTGKQLARSPEGPAQPGPLKKKASAVDTRSEAKKKLAAKFGK